MRWGGHLAVVKEQEMYIKYLIGNARGKKNLKAYP
jgi:hypothetical protein